MKIANIIGYTIGILIIIIGVIQGDKELLILGMLFLIYYKDYKDN
jgi:hypothetical protein